MEYDVAFVGLGYVGLSTAVCFADRGINVLGVDIDSKKINRIKNADSPIHEKYMNELLEKAIKKNRLSLSRKVADVTKAKIIFLTVGTPSRKNGSIDLKYIEQASKDIAIAIKDIEEYFVIVIKSTVVPGTALKIIDNLEKHSRKKNSIHFGVIVNPEFLQEGSAINDTLRPDKIVVGVNSEKDKKIIYKLFKKIYRKNLPIVYTTPSNAELIKYANNSLLATKISFMNYISRIAERIPDGDVNEIKNAIGMDKRISESFLNAGLGFGGSCFPKDVKALIAFSKELGVNSEILQSVLAINNTQFMSVFNILNKELGQLEGKRISILGLAFKPETDDIRDATSIKIIKRLLDKKAKVRVYDPIANNNTKRIFGSSITYAKDSESCIRNSDCCIIVTEWKEFKMLKPKDFIRLMKRPLIIDGRRIFSKKQFNKLEYHAIGLG